MKRLGTICQVTPNGSVIQPHCDGVARAGELVPVLVNLPLVLAIDEERETFGELEVGAPVVPHEGLTTDDELGGSDRAVLTLAGEVLDLRVRECGGVERDGRLKLVVEHQEGCHFRHLAVSSVASRLIRSNPRERPIRGKPLWVKPLARASSCAREACLARSGATTAAIRHHLIIVHERGETRPTPASKRVLPNARGPRALARKPERVVQDPASLARMVSASLRWGSLRSTLRRIVFASATRPCPRVARPRK